LSVMLVAVLQHFTFTTVHTHHVKAEKQNANVTLLKHSGVWIILSNLTSEHHVYYAGTP